MRLVRVPPPVLAVLVLFVAAVVWMLLSGRLADRRPIELKRDAAGQPLAELFTPQEYAAFRAAAADDPLERYLYLALDAGREVDALRAVPPDDHPRASERLAELMLGKFKTGDRWPRDETAEGPLVRRLRELEPHLAEPAQSLIAAYLLWCDGEFEQAEAGFAALPPRFRDWKTSRNRHIWVRRMTGFWQRGRWREAYRTLEPRRVAFSHLASRFLGTPEKADEYEELIRLHREADPDDLFLTYHTAHMRYQQRRYADVIDPSAEYLRRAEDLSERPMAAAFYDLDMRHLRAFSLAMLGRYEEAAAFDDQLTETMMGHEYTDPRDRVRLAIALHSGDVDKADGVLASSQHLRTYWHADPHLAPLFMAEKFAKLRDKYPPPKK